MTTEEFHVVLESILSIAFKAGGRGVFWIGTGALIGFVAAALSVFGVYRVLSRREWPSPASIGLWGRRGLLVFWIFTVPFSLGMAGAGWGSVVAVVKTLDAEGAIDSAGVAVLREPLAVACVLTDEWVAEENWSQKEKERRKREFQAGERKIDLQQIEQQEQELREEIHDAIERYLIDTKTPEEASSLERLMAWAVRAFVLEGEVDSLMDHAHETLAELRNRHGVEPVAVDQIAAVIVELHLKQYIFQELRVFSWLCVKFALGELLLLLAIPLVCVEVLRKFFFKDAGGSLRSSEDSDAPVLPKNPG